MLTRSQFYLLQGGGFVLCLGFVLAGSWLADRLIHLEWLSAVVGFAVLVFGQTAFQFLFRGHLSYRKYVAAAGGQLRPPSRFWATHGPWLVTLFALSVLVLVTVLASGAADDSRWRRCAGLAWLVLPAGTMIFWLVARDWRNELSEGTPPSRPAL